MGKNELVTYFVWNNSDDSKIDLTRNKLFALDADLNNLGKNSLLGTNIANSIKPAETALDSLNKKVESSINKPTISGYWENEERKTVASLKNIENAVEKTAKTTKPRNNPGADSLNRVSEFGRSQNVGQEIDTISNKFSVLQSKAQQTKLAFSDIAAQNLKTGKFTNLTKEIEIARDRSRQLESDIKSIQKELASPNRKSSIKFLTEELRGAETEADSLNRKLLLVQSKDGDGKRGGGSGSAGGGRRGGISEKQAAALEIFDDFAPEGLNKPFNALARAGLAAENIKEAAGEMSVLSKLSLTTLGVFGAIGVAGFLIVDATRKAREEAEKRLKQETLITAEFNKQHLAQKQAVKDLRNAEIEQKFGRSFASELTNLDDEGLKRRQATSRRIFSLSPTAETAEKEKGIILAINDELARRAETRTKQADDSFNRRNENFKTFEQSSIEFEKKSQIEIEKGIEKVKELGKTYNSVFQNLSLKSNSNNPFVQIFAESRSELDKLKDSIKGLPDDLQRAAIASQQAINRNKLFETRLDNDLSAFDLREDAARFRGQPTSLKIDDIDKFFADFIEDELKRIAKRNGGAGLKYNTSIANGLFYGITQTTGDPLKNFNSNIFAGKDGKYYTNGFSQNTENPLIGYSSNIFSDKNGKQFTNGFSQYQRSFADLTESEKLQFFNKSQSQGLDESLNSRLTKQLSIIYSDAFSAQENSIADKKFIALTSGVDPSRLSGDLQEKAALAREREADRREKYESEALQIQRDDLELQRRIAEGQEKLLKIAETQGLDGLNKYLEITVKGDNIKSVTGSSGTQEDVRSTYFEDAF